MSGDNSTSVFKMLDDLKSTQESTKKIGDSNEKLRLSGIGMPPPPPSVLSLSSAGINFDDDLKRVSGVCNIQDDSSICVSSLNDTTSPLLKRKRVNTDSNQSSISNSKSIQVPASPWELRRLKAEIVSLRTRLSHQDSTIKQLHSIRQQMEEIYLKDKNMLENELETYKQTIKQMELRIETGRKATQDALRAQNMAENDISQMKIKLEQKIIALTNENLKLKESLKLNNNNNPENVSLSSLKDDSILQQVQMELKTAKIRINELEQKQKIFCKLEEQIEFQKLEIQSSRIKIDKLESERSLWAEGKQLVSQASKATELEKELNLAKDIISKLREAVQGKLLLEEQMFTMKQRLEHIERVEHRVAELEVKCNELTGKLWEYQAIGIGDGPAALKREINRLQQAEAILTSEEGQLRSQLDALQRENQNIQRKYDEAKKIASEMTSSTEKSNKICSRLQKKILLISRERDSYRQQLDLYEKELTVDTNNVLNERVPSLEKTLEGYRDWVAKLEAELSSVENIASKDEFIRLKEENEKLKGEIEHRALKGDFNTNARILHFKMNPAAIASQQAEEKMAALLKELEELKAKNVEAGGGNTDTPITNSVHAQEIIELKQSHEIKIARLKDAFKASSQEFRQACYQLFGWRVDRTKEGRYKLSSQYAESPDDFLFFHVGEAVDLLETTFSASLGSLIEHYLEKQHSVPMFLCAVQSELFSQQTVANNA